MILVAKKKRLSRKGSWSATSTKGGTNSGGEQEFVVRFRMRDQRQAQEWVKDINEVLSFIRSGLDPNANITFGTSTVTRNKTHRATALGLGARPAASPRLKKNLSAPGSSAPGIDKRTAIEKGAAVSRPGGSRSLKMAASERAQKTVGAWFCRFLSVLSTVLLQFCTVVGFLFNFHLLRLRYACFCRQLSGNVSSSSFRRPVFDYEFDDQEEEPATNGSTAHQVCDKDTWW